MPRNMIEGRTAVEKPAVKVTYWTRQEGEFSHEDLNDIEKFRSELADEYVAVVRGRPGDLGGLYELAVEFVTSLSLAEFAGIIGSGVAYDLVKAGTKSFVLRPFVTAYRKLLEVNDRRKRRPHIEELHIVFQDSTVTIREIYPGSVIANLENILQTLGQMYSKLIRPSGEAPVHIYIPIFEDPAADRLVQFREPLDVDETYRDVSDADYVRLWGAEYAFARDNRVFDVQRGVLLDAEFLNRFWYEVERKTQCELQRARDAASSGESDASDSQPPKT